MQHTLVSPIEWVLQKIHREDLKMAKKALKKGKKLSGAKSLRQLKSARAGKY